MDINNIVTENFIDLLHDDVINPLISNPEGDFIQNEEILERLDLKINRLKKICYLAGVASVASLASPLYPLLVSGSGTITYYTAESLARVERLYLITSMLLERFGSQGITITAGVKTNNYLIDLFVKMPDKRPFALLLRNYANGAVRWREDKQDFFVYKKGKKARSWDAMTRTTEKLKSILDLKDLKSPLLGTSRTDRNRTIIKAVVLCGKTTVYPGHAAEFMTKIGQAEVLAVYKESLVYVVEQEKLIDFLLPPQKLVVSRTK